MEGNSTAFRGVPIDVAVPVDGQIYYYDGSTNTFKLITGISGTYYVAASSGGAVTTPLTFVNGILTADS